MASWAVRAVLFALSGTTVLASQNSVKIDFIKKRVFDSALAKRSIGYVDVPLGEGEPAHIIYYIPLRVGTPPQQFSLQADTGSSNLWFPSVDSKACKASDGCKEFGGYNANLSSSYELLSNGTFFISYADDAVEQGDYIAETVHIGGVELSKVVAGLAVEADASNGILGLGYPTNEISAVNSGAPFPTVLDALFSEGAIDSHTFSLYLDDQEAGVGSILFGAVDPTKYVGELIALPIQPNASGIYTEYRVDLTGISFVDPSGNSTLITPPETADAVLLDSGTTGINLPTDLAMTIINGLGGVFYQNVYICDCALRDSSAYLNLQFGGPSGPVINVTMAQLISDPLGVAFGYGVDICQLFVAPYDAAEIAANGWILGDSFLRSAYIFFDLDKNEVALAPAKFNSTTGASNAMVVPGTTGTRPGVSSTATAAASLLIQTILSASGSQSATSGTAAVTASTGVPQSAAMPTFSLGVAIPTTGTPSASGASSTSTGAASTLYFNAPLLLAAAGLFGFIGAL